MHKIYALMGLLRLFTGEEESGEQGVDVSHVPTKVADAFVDLTNLDSLKRLEASLVVAKHFNDNAKSDIINGLLNSLDLNEHDSQVDAIARAAYEAVMQLCLHNPTDATQSEPPQEAPIEEKGRIAA
ncbi:MAG: hypothetical protein O2904_03830 [bacterium]|nr:hypothetical protein [bacterium]